VASATVRIGPVIYPTPEIMRNLEFLEGLGKNTRLYDEIWTRVKSK
jgi:spermidine/putrescine transport system substrate-binding protein